MKTGNKHGHHWITDQRRLAIYLKFGLACAYCGHSVERGAQLTLDHIKPRSTGGRNDTRNLITACMSCNAGRGDKNFRKWCLSIGKCSYFMRRMARRKLNTDAAKALIVSRGTLSAAVYGSATA